MFNKKYNNAFTLIEVIYTVAIIGVLAVVATITYNKIRSDVLEKQYSNLKVLIENTAKKFSSETGKYNIFVQDLIDQGLLDPDDETNIYDPRDKSVLNCNIISISVDKNGNFVANLTDKSYDTEGVCDSTKIDKYDGNLTITKYLTGTTKVYDPTKSSLKINSSDKYPSIYNGFTSMALDLTANFDDADDTTTDAKYVWNKNMDTITYHPDNKFTTVEYKKYNGTYYVNLLTKDGGNYEARFTYKYDAEAPTIFKERTRLANSSSNLDSWSKSRTVIIYASDNEGVGLSKIYVGTKTCDEFKADPSIGQAAVPGIIQTFNVTEPINTKTNAHVCAIDYLGNVTDGGTIEINKTDGVAPTCSLKLTNGTLGENSYYISNVDVTFASKADQDSGSGIKAYSVSKEGVAKNYNNVATVTHTADTSFTRYNGYVIDNAGNEVKCTTTLKKDTTKPSCALKADRAADNNGWYTSDVKLSFSSKTDNFSLKSYGITTSTTADYNSKTEVTQTYDTLGQKHYGYVKDAAGNTNKCEITVKKDATPPTCTKYLSHANPSSSTAAQQDADKYTPYEWTGKNVYFTLRSCTDNKSGINLGEYKWKENDIQGWVYGNFNWQSGNDIGRNYTGNTYTGVTIKICDHAGNCTDYHSGDIMIDKTVPTISFEPQTGPYCAGYDAYKPHTIFKFKCNTGPSGQASFNVTLSGGIYNNNPIDYVNGADPAQDESNRYQFIANCKGNNGLVTEQGWSARILGSSPAECAGSSSTATPTPTTPSTNYTGVHRASCAVNLSSSNSPITEATAKTTCSNGYRYLSEIPADPYFGCKSVTTSYTLIKDVNRVLIGGDYKIGGTTKYINDGTSYYQGKCNISNNECTSISKSSDYYSYIRTNSEQAATGTYTIMKCTAFRNGSEYIASANTSINSICCN